MVTRRMDYLNTALSVEKAILSMYVDLRSYFVADLHQFRAQLLLFDNDNYMPR